MLDPSAPVMFDAPAEAYDRMMGRYLATLGPAFADAARITSGMRVLDVGCGPGGLTAELVQRVGADHVTAVDPSSPFAAACAERLPGVDVRVGWAEDLPFADGRFDATLGSLVVPFMEDRERGVREMTRVTRPGGTVAVCFWNVQRMDSIRTFWAAAAAVDPTSSAQAEHSNLYGTQPDDLASLLRRAGLTDVLESTIAARSTYEDFDAWWTPFLAGVGPIGTYVAGLAEDHRAEVREACDDLFGHPREPFTLVAEAWCAVGRVRPLDEASPPGR